MVSANGFTHMGMILCVISRNPIKKLRGYNYKMKAESLAQKRVNFMGAGDNVSHNAQAII